METSLSFQYALCWKATMKTSEILAYFDSLEPVSPEFMSGQWKGASYFSGHPWDGLLEKYHWYGKSFNGVDDVHPLMFRGLFGKLVPVNPRRMPVSLLRFKFFHLAFFGKIFQIMLPLYRARHSGARLRMIECRGKVGAAMVYDRQPIIDSFRKIDDTRVLGMMDLKGTPRPFFFLLTRDQSFCVEKCTRAPWRLGRNRSDSFQGAFSFTKSSSTCRDVSSMVPELSMI